MNKFIEAFSGGNLLAIAAIEQSSSVDDERERDTKADEYVVSDQHLGRPMTTGTGKRYVVSNTDGSSSIISPKSAAYLRNSQAQAYSQGGLKHSFSKPAGSNTMTNL